MAILQTHFGKHQFSVATFKTINSTLVEMFNYTHQRQYLCNILILNIKKLLILLKKVTYNYMMSLANVFRPLRLFNGEKKDWDQADWKQYKTPSLLLQEEKWTLKESLWTFCPMRRRSGSSHLLQSWTALWVCKQ